MGYVSVGFGFAFSDIVDRFDVVIDGLGFDSIISHIGFVFKDNGIEYITTYRDTRIELD
jgi:hypothetical protein